MNNASLGLDILVESLLFVSGEPVTLMRLAAVLEVDVSAVEEALACLSRRTQNGGLRLQRHNGQVQFVTVPEAAPYLEQFLGLAPENRLSTAALETLALIAYRQPVTRADLEAVRGVNCDGVIRTLLSRELIEETGRLQQAGRPILYGTSFTFLEQFGLSDLGELPTLKDHEPSCAEGNGS